jgi:hypothetical protein
LKPRPVMTKSAFADWGGALRRLVGMLGVMGLVGPAWAGPAERGEPGQGGVVLALVVVGLASFVALELVLWVMAPGPLTATCRVIEQGRGRCFLVGFVGGGLLLALVAALGQYKGVGELVGALVLGLMGLGALIGVTAMAALLGRSVMEMAGRTGSRALVVGLGAALLGLVALFPLVGQVLGIYFVLVGFGGAVWAVVGASGKGQ